MYRNHSFTVGKNRLLAFNCHHFCEIWRKIEQVRIKWILPVEIAYFHLWALLRQRIRKENSISLIVRSSRLGKNKLFIISDVSATYTAAITYHIGSRGNQKLKAWNFQLRKNYFCMLNVEHPIAHQSSITFFFIHPVFLMWWLHNS